MKKRTPFTDVKKHDLVMPVGKCYETVSRFGGDNIDNYKYKVCRVVTIDYTMATMEVVRIYGDSTIMRIAYDDVITIHKDIADKYELMKVISGRGLIKNGACVDAMEIYLKVYGYDRVLGQDSFNDAINFENVNDGWIDYLLNEGIIEKVCDKSFPIGSTYRRGSNMYMLCQVDTMAYQMISLPTNEGDHKFIGKRWDDILSLANPTNELTRGQFEKLVCENANEWERIDGQFIPDKRKQEEVPWVSAERQDV